MNPFERIINRYRTLPEVDLTQGRSIAYSQSTTTRIMELADANVQGNVHGGAIMCITIKHLLTHTSGISRYAGRALLGGQGGKTIEQSVHDLRTLKLSKPVGTAFEYSNTNYLIAGLIVEVTAGCSFADYIQQHILAPLRMEHSYASEDAALRGGLATGYRWWFGVPIPYSAPYLEDAVPAAFIAASAEDMGRYMLALLSGGTLDGASVLSATGVAALHQPQTVTTSPGSLYALGWRVEKLGDLPLYRHGGEVPNFMGEMVLVPELRLGVVVLMNASNGLLQAVVPDVSRMASSVARFRARHASASPPPLLPGLLCSAECCARGAVAVPRLVTGSAAPAS